MGSYKEPVGVLSNGFIPDTHNSLPKRRVKSPPFKFQFVGWRSTTIGLLLSDVQLSPKPQVSELR